MTNDPTPPSSWDAKGAGPAAMAAELAAVRAENERLVAERDEVHSLHHEARNVVDEFLAMYPHGCQRGSLAGELSRCWRVVKHWHGHWQATKEKLRRVRRSAVEYKRAIDFEWHEIRVTRARENQELRTENARLRAAVAEHHGQKMGDRCHEDDDRLYAAFGLPPVDRRIGDPEEMLADCRRFIRNRCEAGGPWKSYRELEAEVSRLAAERDALIRLCIFLPSWSDGTERWAWVGNFGKVPYVAMVKCETDEEARAAVLRAAGIERQDT